MSLLCSDVESLRANVFRRFTFFTPLPRPIYALVTREFATPSHRRAESEGIYQNIPAERISTSGVFLVVRDGFPWFFHKSVWLLGVHR